MYICILGYVYLYVYFIQIVKKNNLMKNKFKLIIYKVRKNWFLDSWYMYMNFLYVKKFFILKKKNI